MTHWTPARIAEARQRAELAESVTLPVAQFRELLERAEGVAVPPGDMRKAMINAGALANYRANGFSPSTYGMDQKTAWERGMGDTLDAALTAASTFGYTLTKQPSAAVAKINGGGDLR